METSAARIQNEVGHRYNQSKQGIPYMCVTKAVRKGALMTNVKV